MKVYDFQAPTPQGPAARDEQAFLLALSFHEAALRAAERKGKAKTIALCPMIVSYGFAAELYLKALASSHGGLGPIRAHKLPVLLKRLGAPVVEHVAAEYDLRTGRPAATMEGDVRALSAVFEDWRYVFEGDGRQVRVNLLVAFTKSLFVAARAFHPEWSMVGYREARFIADDPEPIMTAVNLGGGTFVKVIDGTGGTLNTRHA